MKELAFPTDCTTPEQRYRFACRAKEEMTREHNLVSRMAREPLTREQYDEGVEPLRRNPAVAERSMVLPDEIKAELPHKPGQVVTPVEFRRYLRMSWQPRMEAVHEALAECRKAQEGIHARAKLAVDTGKITREVSR